MKKVLTAACVFALAATLGWSSEEPTPGYVKTMKALGSQSGAIRKGEEVQKNAEEMAETLKQVAAFRKPRNSEMADKAVEDSMKGAQAVAAAAKAGNQEGIAAGAKLIGAGCRGCHDAHREKVSENVYKIK